MRRLRLVIGIILSFLPAMLVADAFQVKKDQYTERLDMQIQKLTEAKTCASESKNMAELRKCRQANKAAMKELKAMLKEKYSSNKEKKTETPAAEGKETEKVADSDENANSDED